MTLHVADGLLMHWTHELEAPWQTPEWREQMRTQLRANGFLRLIENRWVSTESEFLPPGAWEACEDPGHRPLLAGRMRPVWVGVDASTKKDYTAIVVCGYDRETSRVELLNHWTFRPTQAEPLDFEATVERTLVAVREMYLVRTVRYDPYQMAATAQRCTKAGLPMEEFSQTVPNLTRMAQNLYDLVIGKNLRLYANDDMRLAASRAVAVENPRGWRLTKEKASHKIDVIVALAMAALAAVEGGPSQVELAMAQRAGEVNAELATQSDGAGEFVGPFDRHNPWWRDT